MALAAALLLGFAVSWALGQHASSLAIGAAGLCWLVVAEAKRRREAAAAAAAGGVVAARERERDRLAAQLQAMLDAVGEAVVVTDQRGAVLAANGTCADLLGFLSGQARGRLLADVVDWPQLAAAVAECLRTAAPRGFEGARGAGAGARTFAVAVTPWRSAAGAEGAVVVAEDLSRLRQLESHRRDFVANVSHELKTPLAAIQGLVETLQDDPGMAEATRQRFLEKVARQTERLGALVRDLLALSRLDGERGWNMDEETCDLGTMARESMRDLQPLAERKQLRLQLDAPEAAVSIRVEPELLRQVVTNLVDNAVKYTPAGGSVSVRVRADGSTAWLEVEDTGIGLSSEDQERVFERFYRVDRARSRELGGTGLGLAIVKNTALNLGGQVGVRSRLGAGSTFWVQLPLARDGGPG